MTLPSPAEQIASRKRLQAVFYTPKPEPVAAPKFRAYRPNAFRVPFVIDPFAPRCAWPRNTARDWILISDVAYQPNIRISVILEAVSEKYAITQTDILSHRRTHKVVRPRQIAMYLAKELTVRSLPEIGRRFGGRDHTTVLHAVRKITALREADEVVAVELKQLTDKIRKWSGV